jgi:hypothetical protein
MSDNPRARHFVHKEVGAGTLLSDQASAREKRDVA